MPDNNASESAPIPADLSRFQRGPGPVPGVTVTGQQALDYLRAVMRKYRSWDSGAYPEFDDGRGWFGDNPPLPGDMPFIFWAHEDSPHPVIVWEGGSPYEWAFTPVQDDYTDEESGSRIRGVPAPEGVFAEPCYSFTLVLYPGH